MIKPNDTTPLEVELKLAFAPDARERIESHSAFHGPGAAGPKTAHQISTYFDTPDLSLARSGLSLRVRVLGERRTQTLKSPAIGGSAAAARGEWEWAVSSDRPDPGLLAGTPAAEYAADTLKPVVITDIHRTTRMLTLNNGTIVEAAIDEGSIRAGETECPVHELELELKEGPPGPLFQLALALHTELPLRLEPEAKATRGYHLLTGRPPEPSKTPKPALEQDVGSAEAFRRILGAALGALIANQPAAAGGDPEGVHQMRIAMRRLRTALVLFGPHLEEHATARFEEELRRLGRILGEARDWDVFTLETLPAALDDGHRGLLAAAAESERRAAGDRLREEFARPNLTGLVLALAAWAEDDMHLLDKEARKARLAELAPALLKRLMGKTVKRGRHIARLSGPELHGVRKALKKLRYAVEDLEALFEEKRVKSFLKHCKGLQESLGIINDSVMAVTLSEALSGSGQPDRIPALAAVAQWSETRRRRALRTLPEEWKEFRDASTFWD